MTTIGIIGSGHVGSSLAIPRVTRSAGRWRWPGTTGPPSSL